MLDRVTPIKTDAGADLAPAFTTIDFQIETQCRISNDENEANIVSSMKRGLPEFFDRIDLEMPKGEPLAIVGGGYSLKETLGELRKFRRIMVCGTAHDYLIDEGFSPTYSVICDGEPKVKQFIRQGAPFTEYFVASSCNPVVFDALSDRAVTTWHTAWCVDEDAFKRLGITKRVGGGCTVALNALPLAILMGYSDLHFFGFDSCRKDRWHSYSQGLLKREEIKTKVVGAANDRVYISTAEMIAQAQQFVTMTVNFGHLFRYTVHGDGLIAGMIQHSKEQEKETTL